MTEQEYRNHYGVNKSTLWEIRKSPKHYKWLLEHPGEDTPALRIGRAIHMAVLQPDDTAAVIIESENAASVFGNSGIALAVIFLALLAASGILAYILKKKKQR